MAPSGGSPDAGTTKGLVTVTVVRPFVVAAGSAAVR